nr:hypothetical protein [Tanacetum cinerariifolium]
LQKTKEQMDEEDSRALKRLSESREDKAAKMQKLDEEVAELKRHLQIVPNDDDDVYTEATPVARKVPVVDYEIYNLVFQGRIIADMDADKDVTLKNVVVVTKDVKDAETEECSDVQGRQAE